MSQMHNPNNSGAQKNPEPGLLALGFQCVCLPLPSYKHSALRDNKPREQKEHPSKPSLLTQNQYAFLASILATRVKENAEQCEGK